MSQTVRLPTVSLIEIPPHVNDWKLMLQYLLDEHNIAIFGGLGRSFGQVVSV